MKESPIRPLESMLTSESRLILFRYSGWISSEYEGNRWIHDAMPVDSVGQVRLHQQMLKKLLKEG